MDLEEYLQCHSLNELMEMYVEASTRLFDSKIDEESKEVIKNNEKMLSDIELAIDKKIAEIHT